CGRRDSRIMVIFDRDCGAVRGDHYHRHYLACDGRWLEKCAPRGARGERRYRRAPPATTPLALGGRRTIGLGTGHQCTDAPPSAGGGPAAAVPACLRHGARRLPTARRRRRCSSGGSVVRLAPTLRRLHGLVVPILDDERPGCGGEF